MDEPQIINGRPYRRFKAKTKMMFFLTDELALDTTLPTLLSKVRTPFKRVKRLKDY